MEGKQKVVFFEVDKYEKEFLSRHLEHKAQLTFYSHRLTPEYVDEAKEANYIVSFIYSNLGTVVLDQLKHLKGIVTMSAGYDHIDLPEAKKREIVVSNVPAYGVNTVAEHAVALLMALSRKIVSSVERTKLGEYDYTGLRGWDLAGRTLGIIGTGKIGSNVARIAKGLDMKLLAYDPHPNKDLNEQLGVEFVTLDDIYHHADVITLHVPLSKNSKHMLSTNEFEKMKPGMVLINTARGGLVDPDALLNALNSGIVKKAGIDVLEAEGVLKEERELLSPYFKLHDYQTAIVNHALMHHPNVIVTPHNAFNSEESIRKILSTTVEDIEGMLEDKPVNTITV